MENLNCKAITRTNELEKTKAKKSMRNYKKITNEKERDRNNT